MKRWLAILALGCLTASAQLPFFLGQQGALLGGFRPTDIAGCVLWLDGSSNTSNPGSDGDAVSSWNDLSGNGNHATQGTSANRPTKKTGQINGLSVVRCDGVNDYLDISTAFQPFDTAWTVFVVWRSALVDGNWHTVMIQGNPASTAGERRFAFLQNGGFAAPTDSATMFWNQDGTTYGHNNAITVNTTYLHTLGRSGSTPIYRQDSAAGTTSGSSFDGSGTNPVRFGMYQDGSTVPFSGDIAEVIVYDTSLGTTDRDFVEAYLTNKWGL